ncbi:unnamed protein product [Symbiodinium sp. KB8]|nr:unnamed protein product [Symbiodinium sp. KB8]
METTQPPSPSVCLREHAPAGGPAEAATALLETGLAGQPICNRATAHAATPAAPKRSRSPPVAQSGSNAAQWDYGSPSKRPRAAMASQAASPDRFDSGGGARLKPAKPANSLELLMQMVPDDQSSARVNRMSGMELSPKPEPDSVARRTIGEERPGARPPPGQPRDTAPTPPASARSSARIVSTPLSAPLPADDGNALEAGAKAEAATITEVQVKLSPDDGGGRGSCRPGPRTAEPDVSAASGVPSSPTRVVEAQSEAPPAPTKLKDPTATERVACVPDHLSRSLDDELSAASSCLGEHRAGASAARECSAALPPTLRRAVRRFSSLPATAPTPGRHRDGERPFLRTMLRRAARPEPEPVPDPPSPVIGAGRGAPAAPSPVLRPAPPAAPEPTASLVSANGLSCAPPADSLAAERLALETPPPTPAPPTRPVGTQTLDEEQRSSNAAGGQGVLSRGGRCAAVEPAAPGLLGGTIVILLEEPLAGLPAAVVASEQANAEKLGLEIRVKVASAAKRRSAIQAAQQDALAALEALVPPPECGLDPTHQAAPVQPPGWLLGVALTQATPVAFVRLGATCGIVAGLSAVLRCVAAVSGALQARNGAPGGAGLLGLLPSAELQALDFVTEADRVLRAQPWFVSRASSVSASSARLAWMRSASGMLMHLQEGVAEPGLQVRVASGVQVAPAWLAAAGYLAQSLGAALPGGLSRWGLGQLAVCCQPAGE